MRKTALITALLLALALVLTACAGSTGSDQTSGAPETTTGNVNAFGSTESTETAATTEAEVPTMTAPVNEVTTEAPTEAPTEEPTEATRPENWSTTTGIGKVGMLLPDFSVTTAEGETFTLSEALKDHDLVLINLWATWCGYCKMEFPYLEEAYEEYKDRVEVIALSTEYSDTAEVMMEFAKENNLTFLFAQDEKFRMTRCFNIEGVPTSVLVDRNGQVVWTQVGAMPSTQAFRDVFDEYLPKSDTYGEVKYSVVVKDQNGDPVPGAVVSFCTDEACHPITADENGEAVYEAELGEYHVQVLSLPEGYELDAADAEFNVGTWSGTTNVTVTRQG